MNDKIKVVKTEDLPSKGRYYKDFNGLKLKAVSMERVRDYPEWVFNDGTFYLMDEFDQILSGGTELWFMVDIQDHIVLKYGPKIVVQTYFDTFQEKLRYEASLVENELHYQTMMDMVNYTVMLNVSSLPIEEINRAISSSGYIKTIIENYKLTEGLKNDKS